jgi:hypothetical protein
MAPRAKAKGRQEHPSGPLETVDDDWKNWLRGEMKTRGWDQKDLAGKIPCAEASITNMFKTGPRQTRFKRRIEELCGRVHGARYEQAMERLRRVLPDLSLEDVELIERMAVSLKKKV